MKKLIAASILALLATAGGVNVAQADPPQSGFGNYGLCNAYSRGSEQGQAMKREHGKSFQALEASAEHYVQNDQDQNNNNKTGEDAVAEYCSDNFPHPGQGGGSTGQGNASAGGKKA